MSDAYLFSRIVALAACEDRPLTEALGLSRAAVAALVARHVPDAAGLVEALPPDASPGEGAIEERDLRDYIAEHGATGAEEEAWLAAVIARRSLLSNHLWQDMGFADRGDLNVMFRRHFPKLAERNFSDMKWKKFFYRQLCEREGLTLCKSPNCEICEDFAVCFGEESGDPLATLANLGRAIVKNPA